MTTYIPNIVSGTVTHSTTDNSQDTERAERRTPGWLKALYAILVAVVAITALSLLFAPQETGGGNSGTPECDYGKSTSQTTGKRSK